METDSLVIVLTDQLNGLRQKLIQAENQIIDHKAKGMTAEQWEAVQQFVIKHAVGATEPGKGQ